MRAKTEQVLDKQKKDPSPRAARKAKPMKKKVVKKRTEVEEPL